MALMQGSDVVEVETPHGTVRVRDTGGVGFPVLLVHSLLLDPDLYAAVVPLLVAHGYRCVLPELPLGGHALPLDPDSDLTPPGLALLLVEVLDGGPSASGSQHRTMRSQCDCLACRRRATALVLRGSSGGGCVHAVRAGADRGGGRS